MAALLEKQKAGKLAAEITVVFSDMADAKGLDVARKYGIHTICFHPKTFTSFELYESALVLELQKLHIEWIFCAGYMRIIRATLLSQFKRRIVNIHPSLLPSFPGLKAQKQALEYGVKYSGCTVHFVDSGVDTGPIILQKVVPVLSNDTVDTLSMRILKAEHDTYWKAVNKVMKKHEIHNRTVVFS